MYCRNSRRWSQGFKGVVTLFASGTPDSSPTTNGLCLTGCVGHIMAPLLVGPSALCCSLACILASPVQYQRAVRGPLGKGLPACSRNASVEHHGTLHEKCCRPQPCFCQVRAFPARASAQCLALAWKASRSAICSARLRPWLRPVVTCATLTSVF